jgi:uncharacterized protein YgiM (DUF1202 family)
MKFLSILLSMLILLLAACTAFPQPGGRPAETDDRLPVLTFQLETAAPAPTVTQSSPARPEATSPPAATPDDQAFDQGLADAIVSQDLPGVRARMGERFLLGYWRSEGRELTPDEALAELKQNYFTHGADPVTDFSIDVSSLLEGSNPLTFFGPDAVRAFHVTGLGPSTGQQGIAAIARDPDTGRRYWRGLLLLPDVQPEQFPLDDLNTFVDRLARALEKRDFGALRSMMRERFAIATWNSQLLEFTSQQALQKLRQGALADGAAPAVIFGADVPTLLKGADPLALWGPVATVVRALHVTGLGEDASQEAVIVIGRDAASGQFYWHGVLFPPDGYFHATATYEPGDVLSSDVQYVMALDDVNLRSGPGLNYAVEGKVVEGQIARVSGRSADGQWWRVECEQDASGFCWVSADPRWTEPTSAP